MEDPEGARRWIVVSIGGVAALILTLFLARGGTGAREQPTPVPTPTLAATATPVATATPIVTPTLSPDQALQVHKVFDDLHDMAAGIEPADARQQQVVEQYQQAKSMALRAGVPIQFAEESRRFSREQAFLAAKVSWEDALWQAQVTRTDKQAVMNYATVLRNAGRNFAAKGATEDLRANGLSLLVTCQRIVEKFDLPLGECEADLHELGETGRCRHRRFHHCCSALQPQRVSFVGMTC